MEEFKYGKEILRSFGEVFKNPILLLPFVYIFIVSTIFLFLMPQNPVVSADGVIDYNILVLVIGFGIIQGILGLAFKGMGLIGLRDYVNGEHVVCKNQTIGGLKIFWKLLLLTLLQLIVVAIPVVIGLAIYFGVYVLSPIVANVIGILLILLFIVYVLFAVYFLLFSNVIVSYEGKGAKAAIMDSYNYAKQNSAHTFFTLLTLFLAGLVLFVLLMILYIPFLLSTNPTMVILQSILTSIISVPIGAALLLFVFKAFNNGMGATSRIAVKTEGTSASTALFEKKSPAKVHEVHSKHVVKKKVVKK